MEARAGSTLSARFRLERVLARGAFAEVWEGVDLVMTRAVAVKIPTEAVTEDAALRARFVREAACSARLGGAHVPELVATVSDAEGRLAALVYERLVGETLEARLRARGHLALPRAIAVLAGLLRALVMAHAQGVVHRDVKPANVFLGEAGEAESVHLLDFGVARLAEEDVDHTLTSQNATLGSFPYMAPEQVSDPASVDGRADLYAAGVVAFEMLAGRTPYRAPHAAALLALKLDVDAPSIAEVTGHVLPSDVEELVRLLLARDPDERVPSASAALALTEALAEAMR